MFTKPDYDLAELKESVLKWIRTIYKVLIKPLPKLDRALNAGTVGGKTIDEIRELVFSEIDEHENAIYPHKPTLSHIFQTTALKRFDLESRIEVDWVSRNLIVSSLKVHVLGQIYDVPGLAVPLTQDVRYLILYGIGGATDYTFRLSLSTKPEVSFLRYTLMSFNGNTKEHVVYTQYGVD